MRVVLDESVCDINAAPLYPILLPHRFNVAREELVRSACAIAAVPLSPM